MDNRAVYEKRIVAFVDILGFKTMIEDSVNDITIRQKIKKAMKIIQQTINVDLGISDRKVTTFSDSAVISYLGDAHSSLYYLLVDIIHLQLELGRLGIMVRGGISYGECYHDGKIVFGPAVNEAYRLESKIANWPRVVIDSKTRKEAEEDSVDHGRYTEQYELGAISNCLRVDKEGDNLLYVDYLSQPQELLSVGDEYYKWLKEFRVSIIQGLNRYNKNNKELEISKSEAKKIFDKYRKMLVYWNSVVGDDERPMPVPNMNSENKLRFREMYRKLIISKKYTYI